MKRFTWITSIIYIGLLLNINGSQAQTSKKLAEKILKDHKLDTVLDKAKALLSKGFNAGDGYPQVWIRDLNTFIEISCQVYDHKNHP
jgi:adenine specific DNA methylase Mod